VTDERDPALGGYAADLDNKQDELVSLRLNMALAAAVNELHAMPGWTSLLDRLKTLEAGDLRRLRTEKLGKYKLGYLQGSLRVLSSFQNASKPVPAEALAKAEERCSDLEAQIAELRNILAQ
jgi:hypothetical protein